jgi:hypothetical protein
MYWIVLLAALVASANILLNLLTASAAAQSQSWFNLFFTPAFGFAILTGIFSLLLVATLYHLGKQAQFGMANAVLMIGGLSIVGGTIAAVLLRGDILHWTEWLLLILIICFMVVRYFVVSSGSL